MKILFAVLIGVLAVLIAGFVIVFLADDGEEEFVAAYAGYSEPGGSTVVRPGTNGGGRQIVLEETLSGNRFQASLNGVVTAGRLVVGNPGINDLSVSASSYVSRRHFKIFQRNNAAYIENMSKSGTKLNGIEVTVPTMLKPGDVITIGDVQLRVISA